MTVTDRLSLLHFEHLSLDGVASAQFSVALDELRQVLLGARCEHAAALYLGDIAQAINREELAFAKGQAIGFTHGLMVAKEIGQNEVDELNALIQRAANRSSLYL